MSNKEADYTAENVSYNDKGLPTFDVYHNGEFVINLSMNVGGEHNIQNALAITAASEFLGITKDAIKKGLEEFTRTKQKNKYFGTKS